MSNKLRITRAAEGDSISAIVPFEAPQGLIVNFDSSEPGNFAKASGVRGALLVRDVTTEGPTLQQEVFRNSILNPVKVGEPGSARFVREIEVEGSGLVLASGTGAITSGTGAGTELSTNAGRLSEKQNGEELVGWLRAQLTKEDADNGCRILVQFA